MENLYRKYVTSDMTLWMLFIFAYCEKRLHIVVIVTGVPCPIIRAGRSVF
jgi:hypothetical protein